MKGKKFKNELLKKFEIKKEQLHHVKGGHTICKFKAGSDLADAVGP